MVTKAVAEVMAASRMINVRYAIRDLAVVAEEVAREGHEDPLPQHRRSLQVRLPHAAAHDRGRAEGDGRWPQRIRRVAGHKPAVEAIRNQAERNGFRDIQSIFIGYGSGEVIDSCLTALLNPGDNLLTPSPEYPLYGAIMAKLDCPVNAYDLDEDNGWEPDVDDIARKINSRTRAILLITPNNPTGAVYSRRTLEKILELARQHGLIDLRRRNLRQADLRSHREACLHRDAGH